MVTKLNNGGDDDAVDNEDSAGTELEQVFHFGSALFIQQWPNFNSCTEEFSALISMML